VDLQKQKIIVHHLEADDFPVIYIGYIMSHYGHFLVDSIGRLWPEELVNSKIKLAIILEGEMPEFIRCFFELLGIKNDDILIVNENCQFKKVYIPDCSYWYANYVTNEFRGIYDRVINKVQLNRPTYEKIYFSRVHFAAKGISRKNGKYIQREYGEIIIEKIFADNGFKVLYPEELSLEEQIFYINNCNILITTQGTIAHNIIFSKQGIKLVVINKFRESCFGNFHQQMINELRNIEYVVIDAYANGSHRALSLLYPSRNLRRFLEDNDYKLRFSLIDVANIIWSFVIFYGRICSRKLKELVRRFK